jgi:hypothetical protein
MSIDRFLYLAGYGFLIAGGLVSVAAFVMLLSELWSQKKERER